MWQRDILNTYIQQTPWTPLIPVRVRPEDPVIWCKLEFLNPSGSTKDRIAVYILGKALRQGKLEPGGLVIEASSGSTGIAMALACAQFGLRFLAIMPEGVSNERTLMVRAFGGNVFFSPASKGLPGAIQKAERLAKERGGFLPRQFSNPDNPEAHRRQTVQEIMSQIPAGRVDAVVSGVGTGGTLVGLYQGCRDHGCSVRPCLARPIDGTAVAEAECCSFSPHIPGVIEGLSQIYSTAYLPDLLEIEIDDREALQITRDLIKRGFPVGPSSGLNYLAAIHAARKLSPDAVVVTVFPDRMERYFSTQLFQAGT